MTECPFLSTSDNIIECFRECALYNYKGTGGVCPFQNVNEYRINNLEYKEELEFDEKELSFIKECYMEMHSEYL